MPLRSSVSSAMASDPPLLNATSLFPCHDPFSPARRRLLGPPGPSSIALYLWCQPGLGVGVGMGACVGVGTGTGTVRAWGAGMRGCGNVCARECGNAWVRERERVGVCVRERVLAWVRERVRGWVRERVRAWVREWEWVRAQESKAMGME